MKYADLRDFLAQLERRGLLKRIGAEVDPHLEMTEICARVLAASGPALLFEKPKAHSIPVLANLFGTPQRVALAMGEESVDALRDVGKLLAALKEPEPPKGFKDAWQNTRPLMMQLMNMAPKECASAPCQAIVWEGADVDLARLFSQEFWDERYSSVEMGPSPDWVKLAEAFGATGMRCEDEADLEEMMGKALETDGPVLVDVRVTQKENCYPMIPAGAAARDMVG